VDGRQRRHHQSVEANTDPAIVDTHGWAAFAVSERPGKAVYGFDVDNDPPADGPLVESAPVRQPRFDEGPGSVLTPMGQANSVGAFARGLGLRRLQIALKIALGIGAGSLLLLAILAALQ
jgi:hypothetical protein